VDARVICKEIAVARRTSMTYGRPKSTPNIRIPLAREVAAMKSTRRVTDPITAPATSPPNPEFNESFLFLAASQRHSEAAKDAPTIPNQTAGRTIARVSALRSDFTGAPEPNFLSDATGSGAHAAAPDP